MWKHMIAVIVIVLVMLAGCSLFRAGAEVQPTVGIRVRAGAVDTPYGSGEDLDVEIDVEAPIDLDIEAEKPDADSH